MQAEIVIRALAALAQEHRLATFRLLVQAGAEGIAAGALAEQVGLPASSMSFHLAQLSWLPSGAKAGRLSIRRITPRWAR